MVLVSDTIRWKVVKMAHKVTDDLEVAKMLLDCYDAIISGCLQWQNNTKKKRLPFGTSEAGWELLEEIKFMMEWKDRQDWETSAIDYEIDYGNNVMLVWKDDDDDQVDEQTSDRGNKDANEETVEDTVDSNNRQDDIDADDDSNNGDKDDDKEWKPEDNIANDQKRSEKNTSRSVKPKRLLVIDNQGSSGGQTSVKRKKTYAAKGYKKTGRPTKAIEILNTPQQTKVLECKRCIDRFTAVEDLVKHFQTHTESIIIGTKVHQVSKLKLDDIPLIATIFIPCKDCGDLTDNLESHRLNKHFRRMCEICGNWFTSFGGWSRHMKTHKAKEAGVNPHVCDKCGKGFALVGTMTMHRKLHFSERPHICEVCGKCFKLRSRLMRHRSIHTAKALSCEFCGKTFNYKFNLKTHLRTHTGERPFVCTVCKKSYSHNSSLKSHAKSEHGINMEFGCQALTEFDGEGGEDSSEKCGLPSTQPPVSASIHMAEHQPMASTVNVMVQKTETSYQYPSESVLIKF